MIALLFVCLVNTCRSPALMGYMNHLIETHGMQKKGYADSCALSTSFFGMSPDQKMVEIANYNSIYYDHKSKPFEMSFFETYDAIFGVTHEIVEALKAKSPGAQEKLKIYHVCFFSQKYPQIDIDNPHVKGEKGFEITWEMIKDACLGIFNHFFSKP